MVVSTLTAAQEALLGKWKLESSENFDTYMKEIGIGVMKRTIGNNIKPVMVFSCDGETWCVKVESTFKNDQWQFENGVRTKITTIDGRIFWCTVTISEDGVWTEEQERAEEDKNAIPSTVTRKIVDGKLIVECKANGVVATRTFHRI
ncbi:fatty acid-binding proteinepidermal-like protein [Aphelenchoides avenae]|nr:fatty acid-binding proteinepidermal-like protein [Aphelenchus avenae]